MNFDCFGSKAETPIVCEAGMRETDPIRRLASLLSARPLTCDPYRLDDLLLGIAAESARLGARPYVLSLYQQVYDYEGLTEYVFLLDSFDSLVEATEVANAAASRIMKLKTSAPDRYRKNWGVESEGGIHFLPKPPPGNPLEVVFSRTFKLRSGPYDTECSCLRVIGRFSGPVVSKELFQYIGKTSELWSYFVKCGASVHKGSPRPSPLREEEIHDGSNAASAGEVDHHALDEELEQTLQDLAKFAEQHKEALERVQHQREPEFRQQPSEESAASPKPSSELPPVPNRKPNPGAPTGPELKKVADKLVKAAVRNLNYNSVRDNPEPEKQQRRKGNDHSLLHAYLFKPETVKLLLREPLRVQQVADRWVSG